MLNDRPEEGFAPEETSAVKGGQPARAPVDNGSAALSSPETDVKPGLNGASPAPTIPRNGKSSTKPRSQKSPSIEAEGQDVEVLIPRTTVRNPQAKPQKPQADVPPSTISGPLVSGPLFMDSVEDNAALPGIAGLPALQRVEQTPAQAAHTFRARRRLMLWAGLTLLLMVLLIETLILSPWTEPVAGQPPRLAPAIPLTDVDPYGVNLFLHKEVDQWKRQKTLDMADGMGANWIKQQFPWAEIEFAKNSFWDPKNNQSSWDKFDNIVELAEQRGLHIIARIDDTPAWARADDSMPIDVRDDLRGHKGPPSASHMVDFSDFIMKFVARYKGRIAAIQVYNEPNLKAEWHPAVNAEQYVHLLQTAYIAAKSVDHNMIILAAPLSANNEQLAYDGNLNELDYLQAMYYAGAKGYFDAMSANAYGKEYPPEDPPSRAVLNFRRVELLHKVMEDNRDGEKAIWFNEYGWNSSPEGCCATYPWGHVTPEEQADYTVRGIKYAREHWPWAGVFTIWYLRQVGDIPPTQSDYYFSLVNTEFVPGPAYREVKTATQEENRVATPGEWGPLSPAVSAGPNWQIGLRQDVPGGAYIAPSAAAVEGSNPVKALFQGTDVKLTLVPQPSLIPESAITARYYVTVDGGSSDVASDLPRDDKGRAYIDLPVGAQITEVTVVKGLKSQLRTGQHELGITAGELPDGRGGQSRKTAGHLAAPLPQDRPVSLPGIGLLTVEANRAYTLYLLLTLALLAGIGYLGWVLWSSQHVAGRRSPVVIPKSEARNLKS